MGAPEGVSEGDAVLLGVGVLDAVRLGVGVLEGEEPPRRRPRRTRREWPCSSHGQNRNFPKLPGAPHVEGTRSPAQYWHSAGSVRDALVRNGKFPATWLTSPTPELSQTGGGRPAEVLTQSSSAEVPGKLAEPLAKPWPKQARPWPEHISPRLGVEGRSRGRWSCRPTVCGILLLLL